MNGKVIANTPIAVDLWSILKTPNARLFFLTHAHADHLTGLTSSWTEKIYCSEVTAKIVHHKLGISENLLQPLTLNEPHIIDLDSDGLETMTVTLIDANHCPGAVMFLFEGYFGRILYTGDFRYCEAMFDESSILNQVKNIDDLYIDNTYCHPDCNFPSQEQATKEILDLIKGNTDKHIVIPVNELGKENLFEKVALATKTYIQVRPEKLEIFKLLGLRDVFTTDPSEERIRLIPRRFLNANLARKWNEEHPTIVIVPTALMKGLNGQTPYKNAPNIHIIPYSEHSSYSELHEFVERVRPKRLIPIVMYGRGVFGRNCKDRTDLTDFQKYLDKRPRMDFVVPETVQEYMNKARSKPKPVATKLKKSAKPKRKPKATGVVYGTPDSKEKLEVSVEQTNKQVIDQGSAKAVSDSQNSPVELEIFEDLNDQVRIRQFQTRSGRTRTVVECYMDGNSDEIPSADNDEDELAEPLDATADEQDSNENGPEFEDENGIESSKTGVVFGSGDGTKSDDAKSKSMSTDDRRRADRNNNFQCNCALSSDQGIRNFARMIGPKPDYGKLYECLVKK